MSLDFKQLSHEGLRSLVPYKPGKSIEELAREKGLTDIIKMASNENPLGCSPLALKALQSMSSHLIATYPSPVNHPLMAKLAAKYKLDEYQLFFSNGSDYIFSILLNCFALHTGKHILTHDHAFSTYAIQAHALNIPVHQVPITADWHVDVDLLIQACDEQTGLIFLANPNNPTGCLINHEDIAKLIGGIPESTILVVDEAYYEFITSVPSYSGIDLMAKYPNLVITRTFSKIYGLAGLRLGYAIACPEIISLLHKAQLPFSVNQAALTAAYAALDDDEFIKLSLKTNQMGMEQMRAGLTQLQLNFLPSACNFLTFDCKEDALKPYNFLLDRGIIVRPLHPYKMNQYIRVTIGTEEQNARFLNALRAYFQK